MPSKSKRKSIREYYQQRTQTKAIMDIAVKGERKSEAYVNEVYSNFRIARWSSRSDYEGVARENFRTAVVKDNRDTLRKMNPEQRKEFIEAETNKKLEQGWNFYQHRDDLIATGQYEEYRYGDFRNKYVENMRTWAIDEKYIKAIEGANIEQLKNLFRFPNVRKDEKQKTELPILGFSYGRLSGAQLAEAESAIRTALAGSGIPVDEVADTEEVNKYVRAKTYTTIERTPASNAYRRLRTADRPETDTYEELFDKMVDSYEQGRLGIHRTKAGNVYIPFVGSTRKGTKNEQFMSLFERYAKGKGVVFG